MKNNKEGIGNSNGRKIVGSFPKTGEFYDMKDLKIPAVDQRSITFFRKKLCYGFCISIIDGHASKS